MFHNSIELLDYAIREIQVAVNNNKPQIEILLKERFSIDTPAVIRYCDSLEIKKITEMLREEFVDYDIKSVVESKGYLKGIITFSKGPCEIVYPLVWILTLRKK